MQLRSLPLAILSASIAACGQQADKASGGLYARVLAEAATRECLRGKASAPNAAYADHVQKLCDCTKDRIIAANPGPVEDESSRREKLQGALQSCVAEIGVPSGG